MAEHAREPGGHPRAPRSTTPPKHAPQPAAKPAALATGSPTGTLQLQQLAGNRAVTSIVDQIARETLQRVAVKESPPNETLYNQPGAGGKAGAAQFGGDVSYDMTRNGDAGVTITIRIQFMSQSRCGVPKPPGAPANTPDIGDLVGSPDRDPHQRPRQPPRLVPEHRDRTGQALERQAQPGGRGGERLRRQHQEAPAGHLRLGGGVRREGEARPADHRPPHVHASGPVDRQPDRRRQLLPEQGQLRRQRQRDRRPRVRAPAGHRRRVQPVQRDAQQPAAPGGSRQRSQCHGRAGQEDGRADGDVVPAGTAGRRL